MWWPGGRCGWLTTTWWMVYSNKSCFNSSFMILAYIYYRPVGLVGGFDNPWIIYRSESTSLIMVYSVPRRLMSVLTFLHIWATDFEVQRVFFKLILVCVFSLATLENLLGVALCLVQRMKIMINIRSFIRMLNNRKKELTNNKGTAVQRYLIVSLSPRGLRGLRPSSSAPEDDFSLHLIGQGSSSPCSPWSDLSAEAAVTSLFNCLTCSRSNGGILVVLLPTKTLSQRNTWGLFRAQLIGHFASG